MDWVNRLKDYLWTIPYYGEVNNYFDEKKRFVAEAVERFIIDKPAHGS